MAEALKEYTNNYVATMNAEKKPLLTILLESSKYHTVASIADSFDSFCRESVRLKQNMENARELKISESGMGGVVAQMNYDTAWKLYETYTDTALEICAEKLVALFIYKLDEMRRKLEAQTDQKYITWCNTYFIGVHNVSVAYLCRALTHGKDMCGSTRIALKKYNDILFSGRP